MPIFGAAAFDPHKERSSVAIEDTLAALGSLVDAGKIGHIGVSNESSWGVSEFTKQAQIRGLPRIATVQNLYNLTARGFETSLLDETCLRENVSLLHSPGPLSSNIAYQLSVYAAPGDAVVHVFETQTQGMTLSQAQANSAAIQAAMVAEINAQGPSNVSRHCADPSTISVVDVPWRALPPTQEPDSGKWRRPDLIFWRRMGFTIWRSGASSCQPHYRPCFVHSMESQ